MRESLSNLESFYFISKHMTSWSHGPVLHAAPVSCPEALLCQFVAPLHEQRVARVPHVGTDECASYIVIHHSFRVGNIEVQCHGLVQDVADDYAEPFLFL